MRAVIIPEAIEQALVADFLVAAAIAGLLVQNGFFFGGERVDIPCLCVEELLGVQRFGQRPLRRFCVIRGDVGFALRPSGRGAVRLSVIMIMGRGISRRSGWSGGILWRADPAPSPAIANPRTALTTRSLRNIGFLPSPGAS